jgi:hypothetical protein
MTDALEFAIPINRDDAGEAVVLVGAAPALASCAFDFVERVFRVEVTFGDAKVVDVLLDPVEFITFGLVTNILRSFWPRSSGPLRVIISSESERIISSTLLKSLVSGLTLTFYNLSDEHGRSDMIITKARLIPQKPQTLLLDVRVHVPTVFPRREDGEPISRVHTILLSNSAFDDCAEFIVFIQDMPSFLEVSDNQNREGSYSIERCTSHDLDVRLPSSIMQRTATETVLVYRDVKKGQLCGAIFEKVIDKRPQETLATTLDHLFVSESKFRKSHTTFGHVRLRVSCMLDRSVS